MFGERRRIYRRNLEGIFSEVDRRSLSEMFWKLDEEIDYWFSFLFVGNRIIYVFYLLCNFVAFFYCGWRYLFIFFGYMIFFDVCE